MSEAPTPSSSPVTTENKPAPTGNKAMSTTGLALTIAGVVIGAVPLLALAFGSAIKIESLDAVKSFVTAGVVLSAVSLLLGLVATGFNVPGLRQPNLSSGLKTFFSGATLITMALFTTLTVLPRVNAIQGLQNNIVPFAEKIRDNCQTPLNTETDHYNKVLADAPAISPTAPVTQILSQLGTFAAAMSSDATLFQQDAANLQTNLTNLQNLSVPVSKYQALKDGCIKDVKGTIAFLTDTTQVPTAQLVQGLTAGVQALPNTTLPKAGKAVVIALLGANIPASYSAATLLTTAGQYAACSNPLGGSCAVTLTVPPGVPAAAVTPDLKTLYYVIVAVGYDTFVNGAMTAAASNKDPQLTAEGDQLKQDIKDTLKNNLAPLNVDVDKIVQ